MKDILRRLVIRAFHIKDVQLGTKCVVYDNVLVVSNSVLEEIVANDELVVDMSLQILKPGEVDVYANTIMDIIPISTKVLGKMGQGITHTLTGVYVVLTGCDEDGRQMHEFGSSEGILSEHILFGRAGTPSKDDFIIHIDVLLKGGLPFERRLPTAAFRAGDKFIQNIRDTLKTNEAKEADEVLEFFDKQNPGKKRVALIKQVAGQGAMYDNLLFPDEPSGFVGGTSVIDVKNVPIILSPNEYRDGAIRALD